MEIIKLFMWKVLENNLLVNSERKRRGLTESRECLICDDGDETLDHLFRRCTIAVDCWSISNAPPGFNATSHAPLIDWIQFNCNDKRQTSARH